MANSKLLKEAIADAKAVRETAIANAKIALEEAFAPRLQSILSKKLQQEMEDEEEADVNEEYSDGSEAPDEDASDIGTGDNKQPADDANSSSELAKSNPDTDAETAQVGKEDENYDVISEEEDEVPGENQSRIEEDDDMESDEDEMEDEDEDELDLEAIIKELEGELEENDDEEEMHEEESEEEAPVAEEEHEDEAPVAEEESEEEAPVAEEEEIDLDEILREMGYGDDEEEKVEESEEEETNETWKEEKEAELEEAYKVIKSLKRTINEVNLLNAKLLYTNKLFRSYNLTNEQKHKVVETLDRTQNVREVKLVYSTLAESMKIGGTAKKVKQTKLTESFASKKIASTAPKKEIIAESNGLAERFKQLANIK